MSHLPSCVPAVALYTSIPGQLALPESQHAWQWGSLPVVQPVCLTSTGMSHMHILSAHNVSCQSVPMQASDRQLGAIPYGRCSRAVNLLAARDCASNGHR